MANIMQQFRAKNKVTRDGYDLSKRLCFTAKIGELLPTYSRLMMTGQSIEVGNKWETTTMPVNTAAYTRFKEYYEWYFVPLNLLWNKFNNWSVAMRDQQTVATSINGTTVLSDNHPYMTTSDIQVYLSQFPQGEKLNQFGFERAELTKKLLSYLGYGDFYDGFFSIDELRLSPWRLLAYQKICQDWHRYSQWENASPERYNLNYIDGSESSLHIPFDQMDINRQNMFDLNYCNWNKDLFMGLLPNSQEGDAASIILDPEESYNNRLLLTNFTKGNSLTTGTSGRLQASSQLSTDEGNRIYNVTTSNSEQVNLYITAPQIVALRDALGINNFTVLALRQAEALQKYKEITQSNPQDYPSQKQAHFDFRPNEAYSERSRLIHSQSSNIEIRPVINTNITENSDASLNSADVAGYGHSLGSGGTKKFTADVDGVLMCIYHVVPLLDYALSRVDPDNLKTNYTDYAIPEFDKTGMVQVPLAWLTNSRPSWISTFEGTRLLGYAPNYIEYKTDIDEVKGAFKDGSLTSWVAPVTNDYLYQYLFNQVIGTSPDSSRQYTFNGLDYRFFKVNPSVVDSIFSGQIANSSVDTDKFLINCYHDVYSVLPLDRQGLPY